MEEIKDIAQGNHDDGDGTLAKKPKLSQEIKLAEMPVEILEHILVHLDDKSLLRASHVCTLFAAVAETAFAQKYANECYEVDGWSKDGSAFHEVMLSKYGDKIRKIDVNIRKTHERLLDLAEKKGTNLSCIWLRWTPKIIQPTRLTAAHFVRVEGLNRASFTEFIRQNQQLENLQLYYNDVGLLDLLDGLSKLKTLKCLSDSSLANDLPIIRLNALETLQLRLADTNDFVRVLRAITCNELKSLSISRVFGHLDIAVDQICTFPTLVSLQLKSFRVTEDQLEVLGRRLPHLTELGVFVIGNAEQTIQLALRIWPRLTKLTIELGHHDYYQLSDDWKKSMQDLHSRYVMPNTEIKMVHDMSMISSSKDRTFAVDYETDSLEVLWMQNFNEKNLRKMLNAATETCIQIEDLKVTNNCADATLDFSKFMHKCFEPTVAVDIKSNGPITVNANATRLPSFFPHLKVLKIQLENHSAVDLLEKLDEKFCKQIEQLGIDTKDVQNEADQELGLGSDITHLLAKFKNLESLHVTASVNFVIKDLFLLCPKLTAHIRNRKQ